LQKAAQLKGKQLHHGSLQTLLCFLHLSRDLRGQRVSIRFM